MLALLLKALLIDNVLVYFLVPLLTYLKFEISCYLPTLVCWQCLFFFPVIATSHLISLPLHVLWSLGSFFLCFFILVVCSCLTSDLACHVTSPVSYSQQSKGINQHRLGHLPLLMHTSVTVGTALVRATPGPGTGTGP